MTPTDLLLLTVGVTLVCALAGAGLGLVVAAAGRWVATRRATRVDAYRAFCKDR